ncbi:MAG: hypothetical protein QG568_404 [Patescibacteria group bacterium]|nr:hypothetical protein [Patescibacteria group bacterium]
MNSTIQENTSVTSENIILIQRLLKQGEGGILTVDLFWESDPSHGCHMYLYNRAEIEQVDGNGPARWTISTERGTKKVEGADYQTGWEHDRWYTFRPRRIGEETFPNKILADEKIAFFLGMHSTTQKGFGFTDHNLAIYIPNVGGNREHAVRQGLMHIIDEVLKMRADIADSEFDELWRYISQDLKDGKAVLASLIGC